MKRGHRSTTASCTDVLGNADQLATHIKRRPAAAWLHFITSLKLDAEFYQKYAADLRHERGSSSQIQDCCSNVIPYGLLVEFSQLYRT